MPQKPRAKPRSITKQANIWRIREIRRNSPTVSIGRSIDFYQEKNDECPVMALIMDDSHMYCDAWIMWAVGMYAFLGKWGV